ncbi:hypothetical protein C8Q73DRAFT_618047, partial [Cubamyces lactineus]
EDVEEASPDPDDSGFQQDFPKAQRIAEVVPGRRPRQGDYEADAQEVLKLAINLYKSRLCREDAYPTRLTEKTWARNAWFEATEQLQIQLSPTSEVIHIIIRYSWNLRGEIKSIARSCIAGAYGFKPITTAAATLYNRNCAAMLRLGRTFTYETIGTTEDEHEGIYETHVVQTVINRVFYKSPDDDGVVLDKQQHAHHRPFPLRGVALILAAVQCAIDEWDSGLHTNVSFSENTYKLVYIDHVQELQQYDQMSGDDHIVLDICTRLSTHGRLHAKAPVLQQQQESSLTHAAMDRAIAAYRQQRQ